MAEFSVEPLPESTEVEEGRMKDLIFIPSLAIVAFVTILANLLVITAFCIDKRLRRTNNFFVISLTIAGFLTGGYSIPLYCITRWTKTEPLSLCKLCAFLDNSLATITVWTLAMTSLDRYYMVINYKRYKTLVTRTRAKVVLVMVWIYGSAVCAPPLVGWNDYHFSNKTSTCGMMFGENVENPHKVYFLFYFFMSFPIPLLLVTFSYTRIFIQAWGVYKRRERRQSEAYRRSVQSQRLSGALDSQNLTASNCNGSIKPHTRLSSTRALLKSSSRGATAFTRTNSIVGGMNIDKTVRATLMVFMLVLTNITCTFPIFVFSLVLYWSPPSEAMMESKGKALDASYTVSMFLFFLNSALNPIMYGLFNTNFRGTFNSLLRCKLPRISKRSVRYSRINGRVSVAISRSTAPAQATLKQRISNKLYLTPFTNTRSIATESASQFPTTNATAATFTSPSMVTASHHDNLTPVSAKIDRENENPTQFVIQKVDSVTESSTTSNNTEAQKLTKV